MSIMIRHGLHSSVEFPIPSMYDILFTYIYHENQVYMVNIPFVPWMVWVLKSLFQTQSWHHDVTFFFKGWWEHIKPHIMEGLTWTEADFAVKWHQ